ncbi:unnamed protein product [Leptidea sinapis]|uniref:Ral GTPase-activating protein subunit alpha/beta N-terminal domain-containing protein n=1 Tax=Leptidea sinapis TaxID=189913 RepID=A0A5E4Q3D3_9NEOP|nr:unnamed protein product [Leptidea sinapis]
MQWGLDNHEACFPSPPLWRTLREHCASWRHRAQLTEQWTRVSLCLTARLLKHMYGPLFPVMPISEDDANLVPADMSGEAVMQTWYRVLHTIGNPVELCKAHLVTNTPHSLQLPLTPLRPKVNSILHLFGDWLFEAALIGTVPATNSQQRPDGTPPPPSFSDATYKLNMMSFQPGRAVALGALCRVLCSKACREQVLAPYLARSYAALQRGVRDTHTAAAVQAKKIPLDPREKREKFKYNLELDLDGVLVLVPDFINALDRILCEREPKLECGAIDQRELRKAAISLLLSMVAFPYHYRGLPVPEFPGSNEYKFII